MRLLGGLPLSESASRLLLPRPLFRLSVGVSSLLSLVGVLLRSGVEGDPNPPRRSFRLVLAGADGGPLG